MSESTTFSGIIVHTVMLENSLLRKTSRGLQACESEKSSILPPRKCTKSSLERFFHHHKQSLKTAAHQLAGKVRPVPKTITQQHNDQDRQRRHTHRVRHHKKIWELFRAGQHKEEIARIVGISSSSVYRALEHEQPPLREVRHRTHHLPDPYLSYLSTRWNEGCHKRVQLYEEIVAQGYTGSLRTIEKPSRRFVTRKVSQSASEPFCSKKLRLLEVLRS